MAFFAFPLGMVFVVIWLAVTGLIVVLVTGLMKNVPGKPITQIFTGVAIFALSWLLPNASGMWAQRSLDKITTDCGWTVYKKAPPVDGVYVGHSGGRGWSPDNFLAYYPKVQLESRVGEFAEIAAGKQPEPIAKRSLKYGIRTVVDELPDGVQRVSTQIVDFDADEVLAKFVRYDLSPNQPQPGVLRLAYSMVTIQPEACKQVRFDAFESRLLEVLPKAEEGHARPKRT